MADMHRRLEDLQPVNERLHRENHPLRATLQANGRVRDFARPGGRSACHTVQATGLHDLGDDR
ncbi:hypothetical protein THL1_554 [Pseudomonas sp. TCU-HL1]|nr:hypothetical protein THL1_554 [Pseudomonas sp. TCU-HL1]